MPYREGKPLADLIPPDRRRLQAVALVAVSMLAGGALYALGSATMDWLGTRHPSPPIPPQAVEANRLADVTLAGPDGARPLRSGQVSIVHVWLQGCSDCMPAFEALRALHQTGGFGVTAPEVNVSYGRADPTWAARYTVGSNLLWDVGGAAVVKPLGISTFTTLVVDERGYVLHRDRPDRPGYADAVRAVIRERTARAVDDAPGKRLEEEDIERVVARHTQAMRACWTRTSPSVSDVKLTLRLVVDADGATSQIAVEGATGDLSDCIRSDVQTWRFPRPNAPTPLAVPVRLTRS